MSDTATTCGDCGHHVRLCGAAQSHRCDLTGRPVDTICSDICHKFVQATEARIQIQPAKQHVTPKDGATC